jgi:hypothetical protein
MRRGSRIEHQASSHEVSCEVAWRADNMWFSEPLAKMSRHPHPEAPQCVPCDYAGDTSGLPFPMPRGCPCTPEALCAADTTGALNRPPLACGMPRWALLEAHPPSMSAACLSSAPLPALQSESVRLMVSIPFSYLPRLDCHHKASEQHMLPAGAQVHCQVC